MLRFLHLLLFATYLLLPAAAVITAALMRRRENGRPVPLAARLAPLAISFIAGLVMAVAMALIYGRAVGGHVPLRQLFLAAYFATALLLLLRILDAGLLLGLRLVLRVHRPAPPTVVRGLRVFAALALRAIILIIVGLPFIMAALMTYRPKVIPLDDPRSQLGFDFERVEFRSTDGVSLAGWWIPAPEPTGSQDKTNDWGRHTVIVCHGLAANKSNQLILSRLLVPAGYNVLAFDFRAHGESGGQVTGYGALESRDVLGAVQWLRANRPDDAQKIFGVGASMGAVALIGAAADPSPSGQAIDAIATYAAYDDLAALTRDLTGSYFSPALGGLLERIGLPAASLHTGVNLRQFRPANSVRGLWPRPILFIHGQKDEIIPFERGRALRDAASPPRFHIWFPEGSHNDIVSNEAAAGIVLEFFRVARPLPVI